MYSIASWARTNSFFSQFIIGLIHVCLLLIGLETGIRFAVLGFHFPDWMKWIPVGVGMFAILGYFPTRMMVRKEPWEIRRKQLFTIGGWILAGGFLLALLTANYIASPSDFTPSPSAQSIAYRTGTQSNEPVVWKNTDKKTPSWKKSIRKWIKERSADLKKKKSNSGTALGIIGLAILAAGMGALIAVLACSIACNGYGFLAILFLLGGSFLATSIVGFLMQFLFREKTFWQRFGLAAILFLASNLIFFLLVAVFSG